MLQTAAEELVGDAHSKGNWSLSSEIRLTASMPWGGIVFMMNTVAHVQAEAKLRAQKNVVEATKVLLLLLSYSQA